MPLPYVCVLERESLETVDPQREKWAFSKSRKNRREEKQELRHARKLIRLSRAVVPRGRYVEREKFRGPKVSCCLFLGKTNTNSLNISRRPTLDYAQTKSTVCRKKNCLVHTMLPLIAQLLALYCYFHNNLNHSVDAHCQRKPLGYITRKEVGKWRFLAKVA